MGTSASKDEEQLTHAVERVKACLRNHENNVQTIYTAISAQSDSVKMLIQLMSEFQTAGDDRVGLEKGPLKSARDLLTNIQKTMEIQCSALNGSFKVLENFIYDSFQGCIPGSRSVEAEKKPGSPKLRDTPDSICYENEDKHASDAKMMIDDSSKLLVDLQKEKKKLQETINENENTIKKLRGENERLRSETKRLNDTLIRKTDEMKGLQRQKEELERKTNARLSLEYELQRVKDEKQRLQQKVYDLERKVNDLEYEKQKTRERKVSVPVQLYYQRRDELMSAVVEELSAMLDTQMQVKSVQLQILRCENSSNIQPDKPTLVLCINASRLGTDAAAAIEHVPRSGRTALLIFHHKNVHALPNHPSDRMLTSSEFKALGGIFDLAFLSGKGIYPCNMNNIAITGIEEFIRQNIAGQ